MVPAQNRTWHGTNSVLAVITAGDGDAVITTSTLWRSLQRPLTPRHSNPCTVDCTFY